jgi:SnoaL-like domain
MPKAASLTAMLTALALMACPAAAASSADADPLDQASRDGVRTLFKQLIDAENRHDLSAVRPLVWVSPNALFVAKTATPAEGNWAGFWGTEVVLSHLGELYDAGPFHIEPDYDRVKVVGIAPDVAETYAPVNITVAYAGQTPTPKPFLMILNWVRTPEGWRMAADIALPIPPAPPANP